MRLNMVIVYDCCEKCDDDNLRSYGTASYRETLCLAKTVLLDLDSSIEHLDFDQPGRNPCHLIYPAALRIKYTTRRVHFLCLLHVANTGYL
jgi:hypothetical protein